MTELDVISHKLSTLGRVKVRSVDVRDGTDSLENRTIDSLTP